MQSRSFRVRSVIVAAASVAVLGAGSVLITAPAQAAGALTAAKQARVKVQSAVPGTVLSVKKSIRSGYSAWAVSVSRSDGSVVVGYVDVKTGIAFDWTLAASTGAPAIDLDGADSVLKPAEPPMAPASTGNESPVTGLGPGVVTGPVTSPGVSPVTGLGPGVVTGPVTSPGVSPVTGLGPVVSGPSTRSPLTGL